MTESLKVRVDRRDGLAVVYTDGYINNAGGEEIAKAAYALLGTGVNRLLLDLEKTKIVNSIGISILIEILEKVLDSGGKLAFCCDKCLAKWNAMDDAGKKAAFAAKK